MRTRLRTCDALTVQHTTNWDLTFAPEGWVRIRSIEGGPVAYLQLRLSGKDVSSRFNVHATLMADDEPIGARAWRRVPFDWVEELANQEPRRSILLKKSAAGAPAMSALEAYFAQEHALEVSLTIDNEQDDSYEPEPLSKPEGKLTDAFLRDLAVSYRALTARKIPPAPALADQTGAPVRTVHRWVSEARARGFLPPARKGRAG